MSITQLSTEILQKIYGYAELPDVVHLAQTSKKNYKTYLGRRMFILERAVHNSYSPLPDLLKLVIANDPDKTRKPVGTEVRRNATLQSIIQVSPTPKLSLEMIKKMAQYGRTAEKWTDLYPQLRWHFESSNRRLLRTYEKERLRRAIYHHWVYAALFHDQTYTEYAPGHARFFNHDSSDPRLRLLRTYTTIELIQLSEFLANTTQLLESELFPSNTVVQERYASRLPQKALAKLAWGDGEPHRRLIRDITKLNPGEMLHLLEHTSTKAERAEYLFTQGAWFADTPSTLNGALRAVVLERCPEVLDRECETGGCIFPSLSPQGAVSSDEELNNAMFGIVCATPERVLEQLRQNGDASPDGLHVAREDAARGGSAG